MTERRISEGSFDSEGLSQIIRGVTTEFRKGEEVTEINVGGVRRVDVYAMPHESEAPEDLERIDVHFMTVGVSKEGAERERDRLAGILNSYPNPDSLASGPSYIDVGATLGSQDAALRLFALGEVLGMWEVITPERLGFTGHEAVELAGAGMVMTSGYKGK